MPVLRYESHQARHMSIMLYKAVSAIQYFRGHGCDVFLQVLGGLHVPLVFIPVSQEAGSCNQPGMCVD